MSADSWDVVSSWESFESSEEFLSSWFSESDDWFESVSSASVESSDEESPSIKIADKSYDGSDLPDTVKAYVSELLRANQNKTNIEYRLRQLDAARITFINTLKSAVEDSGVSPTEDEE